MNKYDGPCSTCGKEDCSGAPRFKGICPMVPKPDAAVVIREDFKSDPEAAQRTYSTTMEILRQKKDSREIVRSLELPPSITSAVEELVDAVQRMEVPKKKQFEEVKQLFKMVEAWKLKPTHIILGGVAFERTDGVCSGNWVLAGTRMTVWTIGALALKGASHQYIQEAYPHLTAEQINASVAFYAMLRHKEVEKR